MTINSKPLALDTFLTQCPYPCLERITSNLDPKSMRSLLLSCKSVKAAISHNYTSYSEDLNKLKVRILTNSLTNKSEKELFQWFLSSYKDENLLRFKALISSPKFSEISPDCLGYALIEAVKHGRMDIVQGLETSNRFSEISIFDLLVAFVKAKVCNHPNIAQELCKHLEDLEDPDMPVPQLEGFLLNASRYGCLEILQHITSDVSDRPVFYELMERGCFNKCLIEAAKYGHADMVKKLTIIIDFNENVFDQLLTEIAKLGNLEMAQNLISSEVFSRISNTSLKAFISEAAKHGHVKIAAAFLKVDRFNIANAYDIIDPRKTEFIQEIIMHLQPVIENSEEVRPLRLSYDKKLQDLSSQLADPLVYGIHSLMLLKDFVIEASDLIHTEAPDYNDLDILWSLLCSHES